ncbi:unnamed protein product [Ectocarpus sp. CCAP 1310/34]|nr:unnamed protein product [Ectocarpus sp. CCAP 1310/34]
MSYVRLLRLPPHSETIGRGANGWRRHLSARRPTSGGPSSAEHACSGWHKRGHFRTGSHALGKGEGDSMVHAKIQGPTGMRGYEEDNKNSDSISRNWKNENSTMRGAHPKSAALRAWGDARSSFDRERVLLVRSAHSTGSSPFWGALGNEWDHRSGFVQSRPLRSFASSTPTKPDFKAESSDSNKRKGLQPRQRESLGDLLKPSDKEIEPVKDESAQRFKDLQEEYTLYEAARKDPKQASEQVCCLFPRGLSKVEQSQMALTRKKAVAMVKKIPVMTWNATKAIVLFLWEIIKNPIVLKDKLGVAQYHLKEFGRHYWLGLKLLWGDIKTAKKILRRILRGFPMTRRERKQLLRTVSDIFRMVPLAVSLVGIELFFVVPDVLPKSNKESMKAAKIILACSKRTSNAAVRAELGIQSLRSGRDARKLTWQCRMCGMGEERLPRIVWEAKWANKKRGRQPTEWVKVVEDVWRGLDIDEDETLETEGLQGFTEKIYVACGEREEQNLRKETKDKEGLEVYGMLKEGIGFKDYLHGPMDAETKLKVEFRTGDIGLRERRRRHRTVDEEDDEFKCDCSFECEDRVHVVAECPLYKKESEVYVTELGKIDGTYREMFEACKREERTVAVLGHRRWVEKAGRDIVRIDRLGKTFLSHLWQSRKERLTIGDRSCGNNSPSSRGRVAFVLIPFMEFLLPVALKVFPNMLPSTFQVKCIRDIACKADLRIFAMACQSTVLQDNLKEEEKLKKELRLRMAAEDGEESEATTGELTEFIEKAKMGEITNQDIPKFAKMFKVGRQYALTHPSVPTLLVLLVGFAQDELTMDNISRSGLVNMCRYMGVPPFGNDNFLRYCLRSKLRAITQDDQRILWEGVSSLTKQELQEACRERGMRATGLTKQGYVRQLSQWLDLRQLSAYCFVLPLCSTKKSVPISLLIMSRAFTLQAPDPAKALAQSISAMDDDVVTEVMIEAASSEEQKTPEYRTRKLESLTRQNELIEEENRKREEAEQAQEAKKAEEANKAEELKAAELKEAGEVGADGVSSNATAVRCFVRSLGPVQVYVAALETSRPGMVVHASARLLNTFLSLVAMSPSMCASLVKETAEDEAVDRLIEKAAVEAAARTAPGDASPQVEMQEGQQRFGAPSGVETKKGTEPVTTEADLLAPSRGVGVGDRLVASKPAKSKQSKKASKTSAVNTPKVELDQRVGNVADAERQLSESKEEKHTAEDGGNKLTSYLPAHAGRDPCTRRPRLLKNAELAALESLASPSSVEKEKAQLAMMKAALQESLGKVCARRYVLHTASVCGCLLVLAAL